MREDKPMAATLREVWEHLVSHQPSSNSTSSAIRREGLSGRLWCIYCASAMVACSFCASSSIQPPSASCFRWALRLIEDRGIQASTQRSACNVPTGEAAVPNMNRV